MATPETPTPAPAPAPAAKIVYSAEQIGGQRLSACISRVDAMRAEAAAVLAELDALTAEFGEDFCATDIARLRATSMVTLA